MKKIIILFFIILNFSSYSKTLIAKIDLDLKENFNLLEGGNKYEWHNSIYLDLECNSNNEEQNIKEAQISIISIQTDKSQREISFVHKFQNIPYDCLNVKMKIKLQEEDLNIVSTIGGIDFSDNLLRDNFFSNYKTLEIDGYRSEVNIYEKRNFSMKIQTDWEK